MPWRRYLPGECQVLQQYHRLQYGDKRISIYHWQDANTGVESQLSLYNCIIYDNYNNGKQITDQVNSAASGKMNPSHNCYMNSSDLSSKFQESDGNFTGTDLSFPFEDKSYENGKDGVFRFRNARLKNNFRLNEADGLAGNKCLNGNHKCRKWNHPSGNRYGLYQPNQGLRHRYQSYMRLIILPISHHRKRQTAQIL